MTFLSGDVGPSARAEVQPDGSLVVQSGTERGVGGREIHLGVEAGESIVRRVIGARALSDVINIRESLRKISHHAARIAELTIDRAYRIDVG